MLNQTTDKRAVFDFEIDFLNGGGVQGQGFRLDIEGEEIAYRDLADAIVLLISAYAMVSFGRISAWGTAFQCLNLVGESDAGRELGVASCVAISQRKPYLDWRGYGRSNAGKPIEAAWHNRTKSTLTDLRNSCSHLHVFG